MSTSKNEWKDWLQQLFDIGYDTTNYTVNKNGHYEFNCRCNPRCEFFFTDNSPHSTNIKRSWLSTAKKCMGTSCQGKEVREEGAEADLKISDQPPRKKSAKEKASIKFKVCYLYYLNFTSCKIFPYHLVIVHF